jgi:4-amino-4-deoxy-L-arabinose transferase-like glycosyltransferase
MGGGSIDQGGRPNRLALGLFVAAAVLVPLLYAAYTDHIWEDYFITFRHSQNLVEGHGLVYRPGERVHGFTSPLGTLLPALCYWLTGANGYMPALWLFRVLSAVAFAGAGVLFLKALRAGGAGQFVSVAFAVLYLLDAKSVDFSTNGMETAFMLLFFAWGFYLLVRDEPRAWWAVGLSWAGLMWTRPDGCVYVAVLALATLLFATGPRRPRLVALVKSAAVCAVAYLPWFLWAWNYYGSPVPNTIRAKMNYSSAYQHWDEAALLTLKRFPGRSADVLRPTNFDFGGWPAWLGVLTLVLGLFCAVYWIVPSQNRLGRRASFCFALLTLYLSFLAQLFPWYTPPVTVCGLLVLVTAAGAVRTRFLARGRPVPGYLATAFVVLLAVTGAYTLAMSAYEMKVQQAEIEWGNRAKVGRWLKDNVKEGEGVYIECLGYAGYFSGVKMLDHPGLVSPEVIAAARQGPSDFESVGIRLKPEWMVLRPFQAKEMTAKHPDFDALYKPVEVFDVTDRVNAYPFLPGKGYLEYDEKFTVYRRQPEATAASD